MSHTNSNLLRVKDRSISYWNNKVIKNEDLFQSLLRNTNFESSFESLMLWLNFFVRELIRNKINESVYNVLIDQWKHAAKLFVCAKFVEDNRNSFLKIREEYNGISLSEKIEELGRTLFSKKIEELGRTLLSEKIEELGRTLFSEIANVSKDESILICSIFYEKSLSSEVRRIPFATANGEKGQIHLLELRRVKSHSHSIQNPCVFPFPNNYIKSFGIDFSDSINQALQINIKQWDADKTNLKSEIEKMELLPKKDINESELQGKKKELSFMESLGTIKRYGILWDVKPYQPFVHKTNDETNDYQKSVSKIDGKSIGLAAFWGIYFTLRNKFPDERVIFSAALEPNDNNELKLTGVEGIPEKIKAVIEINRNELKENSTNNNSFDGFGIHKSNWSNELLDIIKDKQFKISTLNDDNSLLETYITN